MYGSYDKVKEMTVSEKREYINISAYIADLFVILIVKKRKLLVQTEQP